MWLIKILQFLDELLISIFQRPAYDSDPKDLPMNQPEAETLKPPKVETALPTYLWDTPQNARHSVRVICDEMGLTLAEKNLITAVIQAESGFKNTAVCYNKDKDGNILSKDIGVCQINTHYHIGLGKKWPSEKFVLEHPDKCVVWMISLFKQGHLNWWIAYKNGSYKKYLP